MSKEKKSTIVFAENERRQLEKVRQKMLKNLGRRYTIAELSLYCGMNRSKMMEGFRYFYGKRIGEYLFEERMKLASMQLLQTNKSIKEIALLCGYRSRWSFGVAFLKWSGKTGVSFRAEGQVKL